MIYIKFLQTIVKAENQYIKNCQDIIMSEVNREDLIIPSSISLGIVGHIG